MVAELRQSMKGNYTREVYRLLKEAEEQRRNKKKKTMFRRGKKSFYENAIDEEGQTDSDKSDIAAQKLIQRDMADDVQGDMFTLAMQVDKDRSLTSLYDFEQQENDRKKAQRIIRTIS
jgi:hypothetical protein